MLNLLVVDIKPYFLHLLMDGVQRSPTLTVPKPRFEPQTTFPPEPVRYAPKPAHGLKGLLIG